MSKQNVSIRRYAQPNPWLMSIEPEDAAWILFVPGEGDPQLWVRVKIEAQDPTAIAYAPSGSPEHLAAR